MPGPVESTDEEWLALMIEGLEHGRPGVPGGPPEDIQAQFVGHAGADAMRACFGFYSHTKRRYGPGLAGADVLDFGVGWGRLIRMFAHDVPETQLFGVDVDPEILEVCRETGVPGTLAHVRPGARLPFDDGSFDLAYACSVFSHLSADAAGAALAELGRVLRPGGQLTVTTLGTRFLDLCAAIRSKSVREALTDGERTIDAIFDDPVEARAAFDRGAHVYSGVGGDGGGGVRTDDFYGWAAIPETWLRSHARDFEIEDITDDPAVDQQVVVTLRRRSVAAPR